MSVLSLADHTSAIRRLAGLLAARRQLIWELTKREISERYAGEAFGLFWTVAHPLFLTAIYLLAFGVIFRSRMPDNIGAPHGFIVFFLSGFIPWMSLSEVIGKGPVIILGNAPLVKQIVFPIEILPLKTALSAAISQSIFTCCALLYMVVVDRVVPVMALWLPLLIFVQVIFISGVAFILSSIGVYFRDARELITVFLSGAIFLLPIFYVPGTLSPLIQRVVDLNPLSIVIYCFQDAMYFGRFAHPADWTCFPVMAIGTFYFGYRIFSRLKYSFGSAL